MLLNPDKAAPFSRWVGPAGCLLVHGFTGTPQEMEGLGAYLSERGVSVHCPLLPGHGTRDRDLNMVTWRAWADAVDAGYQTVAGRCGKVFVAGLSMGGVLALHLAAHRPVTGVAAYAAFLRPADWRAPFVDFIKWVHAFDPKSDTGIDVKDASAKAAWCGYDSYPSWGASEMLRLCRHLADDLPEIACPVLLMHGREDHTVRFDQMGAIASRLRSPDVRQVPLANSYHVLTVDLDRDALQHETYSFISRIAGQTMPALRSELRPSYGG
jgi:carboxylesterase